MNEVPGPGQYDSRSTFPAEKSVEEPYIDPRAKHQHMFKSRTDRFNKTVSEATPARGNSALTRSRNDFAMGNSVQTMRPSVSFANRSPSKKLNLTSVRVFVQLGVLRAEFKIDAWTRVL